MNIKKKLNKNFEQHKGDKNEDIDKANDRITTVVRETAESVVKNKKDKPDKLSQRTKNLLKLGKRNTVEYAENNTSVRKSAKNDILEHHILQVETLIENNRGLNIFTRDNVPKKGMYKLKDEQRNIITDRRQILKVIESFYTVLNKSTTPKEIAQGSGKEERR